MVYGTQRRQIDLGFSGPIPPDILVLMGATFLAYTLSAFRTTAGLVAALQLSPRLWQEGFLWQLVTYPFATGYGSALGLIISLWMMLMFGKQVFFFVGRRAFWRHFFITALSAAMAAVAVQIVMAWLGVATVPPFALMIGQQLILVFLITGFATLYGEATILLFFVLPVKAAWFIGLEILFAFLAFLAYHDFAGFVGLCTAVGVAYFSFSGRKPGRFLHELRMRFERRRLERKLRKLRGQGDKGDLVQGPWIH